MSSTMSPKPRSSGRSYHHGDLREAILREANRVLREHGPDGLSLREIARKLGVTEAAPYHHFRDRSALITAIAAAGFEKLHKAFAACVDPDPVERLIGCGQAYVRVGIEEPGAFRAMFGGHIVELHLAARPELYNPGHAARVLLHDLAGEVVAARKLAITKDRMFALMWSLVQGIAWLHVEEEFPDLVPDDAAALALVRTGIEAAIAGLPRRK